MKYKDTECSLFNKKRILRLNDLQQINKIVHLVLNKKETQNKHKILRHKNTKKYYLQNISAVSIHPGWVKTDMGGNNAPLTAAQSIQGISDI